MVLARGIVGGGVGQCPRANLSLSSLSYCVSVGQSCVHPPHVLSVSVASFRAVWQRAPPSHHISSLGPGAASAWPSHHASPCGSRRKVTLRARAAGANSTLGGQVTAWVARAAPCHLGSDPTSRLLPACWVNQGLSSPAGHQRPCPRLLPQLPAWFLLFLRWWWGAEDGPAVPSPSSWQL